jgi:hypothetical protein
MWKFLKAELLRLHREDDGFWNILIPAAASLFGGMFGGNKASDAAKQRAGGASLQELMPLMMQLMNQQQAQSGQHYNLQMQRHQANLPMQDALRQMAMGMLPRQYTQGLPQQPPMSTQPVPQMAPLFPENVMRAPPPPGPNRPAGWAERMRERKGA